MKTNDKYLLIFTLFFCLWGLLYWNINPAQRFNRPHTPVAQPTTSPTELAPEIKPFNVLLLGTDARKEEESRIDVIMLANVDTKNKIVHVISIPRDTRIELPGIGATKINHSHLVGELKGAKQGATAASLQAVSSLLQCKIHYYIKLNFAGFTELIDTIGGIEIELDQPVLLTYAKKTLPEGKQHLDGATALKLVRERYSLPDGDFGRQRLQFLVIKTVTRQLLQPKSLITLPALIKNAETNVVDTNFTVTDLISLAWMFQGLPSEGIIHVQLPGQGGYAFDPLMKAKLYYWFPDLEEVQEISQRILDA